MKDFLLKNRKENSIRLFFDIETLQYNEHEGKKKPTSFKNITYSLGVSYYDDKEIKVKIYPSFKQFFDEVTETFKQWKNNPRIELIAHNNNKYDNHFLRNDLIYFYDLPVKNIFLKHATDEGNVLARKKGSITQTEKQGLILEKRIKSSNNLELVFFLNNIEFFTTDNYVKTNASIDTLGKKLLREGLIASSELKKSFNYTKYNKDYDMSETEARIHAEKTFNNLTDDEIDYIKNDVIILASSVIYYSDIFKGFDYSKITFTSNILEYYNDNDLTSFQLLKSVDKGKDKKHLRYTDYVFNGQNFYDYLKSFYAGGLNFYNDKHVGQIITENCFGIDINSSYPYVMHNYKVPTFLKEFKEFETATKLQPIINPNGDFYLYRMTKKDFDREIIHNIKSLNLRKILVKYYGAKEYMNINTYTIKLIENITKQKIKEISVLSYVSFECEYFGSRDKIAEKYEVKEVGASTKKLNFNNPYDISSTQIENETPYSTGEIDIAKVILNGLYGIPALRSHFNLFRDINGQLENVENGYQNNERNLVFSVFVTAVSLYNLLDPLSYLTDKEIDNDFIYCDTDSLYFKSNVKNKLPDNLFHDFHLGKWSYEETDIQKFTVVNHKKYAYETKKGIEIKAAGIPNDSFNTNMSFENFVKKQFTHLSEIKNLKSIFNKQGTISIYESTTQIKIGQGYRRFSHDENYDQQKKKMFKEIENSNPKQFNDMLYIESNLGSFSLSDIKPHHHESERKQSLDYLKLDERNIKNRYL